MGLLGKKKESKEFVNALDILSQKVFETINEVNNTCKVTGTIVQDNDITVGVTPELLMACGNMPGGNPESCAVLFKTEGVNIFDVSNEAQMDVSASCRFDEDLTEKFNSELSSKVFNDQSSKSDLLTGALKDAINLSGGTSKTKITNKNEIKDVFKKTFTSSTLNTMVSDFKISQRNAIDVNASDKTTIRGVRNIARLQAVFNAVATNQTLTDAMTSVKSEGKNKQDDEETGLVDVFGKLMDSITGIFKGMTTTWMVVIGGVLMAIVVVILALSGAFSSKSSSYGSYPMMPPMPMMPMMPGAYQSPYGFGMMR